MRKKNMFVRNFLFLLVISMVFVNPVLAIDNSVSPNAPNCISKSYDTGALLFIMATQGSAGTTQYAANFNFDTVGNIIGSQNRLNEDIATSKIAYCAVQDPFNHFASGSRIWFVLDDKSVAYSDRHIQDIGAGAYVYPSNPSGYHVVGALTDAPSAELIPKFAFDLSGNVYISEPGLSKIVKKIDVSLPYALQSFYTVTSADYDAVGSTHILDIAIDSDNNLQILIGSASSGSTNNISRVVVDYTGTKIIGNRFLRVAGTTGASYGALIPDLINPSTNFTYGWADSTTSYIYHYSGTDSAKTYIDVNGGALTTFALTDMEYDNHLLYLADASGKLIRSIATNYEGFTGFNVVPNNPDGITGTFTWLNGYGKYTSVITPGAALAFKTTINDIQTGYNNYSYYVGWSTDPISEPSELRDLTNLEGLSMGVFPSSSNDLAGISIYGYLLSKSKIDGSWSVLRSPVKLMISGKTAGYDSITLDKVFYNLTGDTVRATFTYKDGLPWIYVWQLCSRADCFDGNIFTLDALVPGQTTASFYTTGRPQGNYFAVLMKHAIYWPFNEIVASQPFEIRPPVIGVSWDKRTYNLLPVSSISSCQDSTPSTSYFSTVLGYAGLQKGFFSCATVPAAANANNSIMRGSLYAKYNGTFYLNNSLGNVWNGTLSDGSGSLIYVLTSTSPTETWTLTGVNASGETFSARAQVNPEDRMRYSIKIDKAIAYNLDTLYITFTQPIFALSDVYLYDASGTTIATFEASKGSGSYYIDPQKQYVYGTWTAFIGQRGISLPFIGTALFSDVGASTTVEVENSGRPIVDPITDPGGGTRVGGTLETCSFFDNWVQMMFSQINNITRFMFALLFIAAILIMVTIVTKNLGIGVVCAFFPYAFFLYLSLASPCGEYMPVWTGVFIALIIGIKLKWFS